MDECPRSFITAESLRLVELESKTARVHEGGSTFLGPDSSLWPAWWFDVVHTIQSHRSIHLSEESAAEHRKMKREHDAR